MRKTSATGSGARVSEPPTDTERMFIVSPFLDVETVRKAGRWGGTKTRRTLVSIDPEFQRLVREDGQVFSGFQNLCRQPLPNLPQESAVNIEEQNSTAVALTEAEEAPPQGLHAKLMFAARGKRRPLWIGSANATERGWGGNFEIVAELAVNQEVADGIEAFVDTCERYTPIAAENHYAQAETTAREVVKEFEKQRERDGLLEAREILARSLLGTKQCNAASEEIGRALTLAKQSQDPRLRASVAITESRIQDACDSGSSLKGQGAPAECDARFASSWLCSSRSRVQARLRRT